MAYQIEKNIPIPAMIKPGRPPGELAEAVSQLSVGDSFLMDKPRRQRFHQIGKRLGVKVSYRTLADGTVRVWRVA